MEKNEKQFKAEQTGGIVAAPKTPQVRLSRPLFFQKRGVDEMEKKARSNGSFNPAGAGHCAVGADDLGRGYDGVRLCPTMSREMAYQEYVDGMSRSILAGYVVLITILFVIGGLTIWAFLSR